ncbi:hypothetical protein FIBSPDRAFT_1054178 [Athelia psychrophila]|uniref:Cytochrome C oxidase copper chaperone n=1 Tax=Athelia psychrophila TaxID=1759441 RepID=A0A167VQF4_9AGAM|nr:hypothetical protein FIBSPDRAFT_1054178 [Fibularhizoctonia sp. CBS 109695]
MLDKITSWWAGAPAPEKKPYSPSDPKQNPLNPKGLKPCCACPETKSARDNCFMQEGAEADEKCKDLVKQHVACMNALGFKI